jgi:hypothetical protein
MNSAQAMGAKNGCRIWKRRYASAASVTSAKVRA